MVSSISCVPSSVVRTLFFLISIHYCAYSIVFCVLCVLPRILYLRVLSRCHPATPPCSSAVREQPGQVWNGRRMRNLMASRQVSSPPTSKWECWGVSPELILLGFSLSLWSSASTCASNSRMLGDVSLPGRFWNQLHPAKNTWTVHAPGYDVMEFGCLTNRSGNWPFQGSFQYVEATNQCFFVHAPFMCQHTWKGNQKFKSQKRKTNILRKQVRFRSS